MHAGKPSLERVRQFCMNTKKGCAYSTGKSKSKTTFSITEFGFNSRGKRGKGTTEGCQFSHATYSSSCDLALTGLAQSLVFIMGSSEDSTLLALSPLDELRRRRRKAFQMFPSKKDVTDFPASWQSQQEEAHTSSPDRSGMITYADSQRRRTMI